MTQQIPVRHMYSVVTLGASNFGLGYSHIFRESRLAFTSEVLLSSKDCQMRSPSFYLDQKFVKPTLMLQFEICYFIDPH